MTEVVQTETTIPAFRYGGIEVPGATLQTALDTAEYKPAHEHVLTSVSLALKVGLYKVGRDLSLGIGYTNLLPTDVQEAGRAVYNFCSDLPTIGHWHKDAVLIEPRTTIPGNLAPGKEYVAAKYFQNIAGFKRTDDKWDIEPSPETIEERLWLPQGGGNFIVPRDGYNSQFGLPDETTESEEEIQQLLQEAGLPQTELSRFHCGSEGLYVVCSWSDSDGGPLAVCLSDRPSDRDGGLGPFPAVLTSKETTSSKT